MQIGLKITTGNTNAFRLSAIWANVDFTPVTVAPFIAKPNPLTRQAVNRAATY
jgi:hypothetical protein